jgi:hypothetical protein
MLTLSLSFHFSKSHYWPLRHFLAISPLRLAISTLFQLITGISLIFRWLSADFRFSDVFFAGFDYFTAMASSYAYFH